ncbi:glycosyltransferase [Stenotrophomonas koreensis]|uniref:glycosyltransferase n=1 Tax=Stenotrophomonas koreensis TaxID=266128 RepID=UPI00070B847C|nr:glycosyltransferase [Stenotrophomonas koreensis]
MTTPETSTIARTIEHSDATKLVAKPVVSVLILAYNHAPFLARTIESAVSQQVDFEFEVLVGEDCSNDDSLQVALAMQQRFPSLVRIITADNNVGAYQNYLRLLRVARGSLFAQLDGDDYWLPGKLARQVALMRQHPDHAAVYSNACTISADDQPTGLFNDLGDAVLDLAALLRHGNCLNTSTMLYRAELATHLLAIKHEYIDYQIHLVLARHGPLIHIGEPLAAYRTGNSGSMVAASNEKVRELYWQAIESVQRKAISDGDYARGLADFLRRVFFRAVRIHDMTLLRSWATRVYSASPYGTLHTSCLVAWNIARMSAKMLAARLPFAGYRRNVLYRH